MLLAIFDPVASSQKTAEQHFSTAEQLSKTAGQHQDHDNQQDQTQAAARTIAPAAAVRPRRDRAKQHQDADDDQNSEHDGFSLSNDKPTMTRGSTNGA
jgi:hypothetical protein